MSTKLFLSKLISSMTSTIPVLLLACSGSVETAIDFAKRLRLSALQTDQLINSLRIAKAKKPESKHFLRQSFKASRGQVQFAELSPRYLSATRHWLGFALLTLFDLDDFHADINLESIADLKGLYGHGCAASTSGIQCWGDNQSGKTNVPEFLR